MRKTKDLRLVLSRAEIEARLVGADLRDRALVKLLYLTAARVSELIELRPQDLKIDRMSGYLIVYLPTRKNPDSPYRAVPIKLTDPWVYDILEWLKRAREEGWEWLFPGQGRSGHLTDRAVRKIISKLGLGWPHRLRHSRLTELAAKGATDQQLTRWAGWSDSRPAQFYIHLRWQDIKDLA